MLPVQGWVGEELPRGLASADMVRWASFVWRISEERWVCAESKLWQIPKTRGDSKGKLLQVRAFAMAGSLGIECGGEGAGP